MTYHHEADLRVPIATDLARSLPDGRHGRKPARRADPSLVATYARFSSHIQNEISIERQEEVCEEYAKSKGFVVVDRFADRARSGGCVAGRDGLEAMVASAKAGAFSKLMCENVDRVARDLGHLANLFKQLQSIGVEIHQPNKGKLGISDIAFYGLMGDEGRRMLAERAQFSRNASARAGKVPTGACFGYAGVPGQPGELVVHEIEGPLVRRIFDMRLAGLSARAICSVLHAEGVRFPKSGKVTANGIRRLMENPRYAGILVYRKHARMKDRDTGKTTVTVRPREEWIVTERPHLAIVPKEIWDRVQVMPRKSGGSDKLVGVDRTARYLLSELVVCPACGNPLVAGFDRHRTHRFHCGRNRRDMTCDFGQSLNLAELELLVLGLAAEMLDRPAFVEAYVEAYNAEAARADAEHQTARAALVGRCTNLSRKLQASFDRTLTSGISDARVSSFRAAIEFELDEAERKLGEMPPKPRPVGLDRGRIVTLQEAMSEIMERTPFRPTDEAGMRLAASFRELVAKVVAVPSGVMSFDYEVTLRVGSIIDGADRGAPPRMIEHVLRGTHRWRKSCTSTRAERRRDEKLDRQGAFSLSDADWLVVHDLVDPAVLRLAHRADALPRMVVDAALFVAMSTGTWDTLPERFGSDETRAIYHSARNLRRAGIWERICLRLTAHDPAKFAALSA